MNIPNGKEKKNARVDGKPKEKKTEEIIIGTRVENEEENIQRRS